MCTGLQFAGQTCHPHTPSAALPGKSARKGLPECLAHSKATWREGKEGGRWLRTALMRGRDATAVPSTTSTTTSPSNLGASCVARPQLAATQTPLPHLSPFQVLNGTPEEEKQGDAGNFGMQSPQNSASA